MICAARPYLFDQEILDQYQDLISAAAKKAWSQYPMPVSYTHLTLPTKRIV